MNHSPIKNERGLTLLEIIVVMLVITLMLSVSIPAIVSLNRTEALNQAPRVLANHILMARNDAIYNRYRVRVVFVGQAANINRTDENFEKVYRAYSAIAKTNPTLPDNHSLAWTFTTGWNYLPESIVFSSGSVASIDNLPTMQAPLSGQNFYTVNYLEYKPTGRVNSSTSGSITIRGGAVMGSGDTATTSFVNISDTVTITWDNLTGRVRVLRPGAGSGAPVEQ